ncbi:MAG TPA: hypothetical protein VGR02_20680 [Thermoanaerobaculia bacterium]|nr:hypothetical protein [Thermoanaerobaculia bacterium]
MTHSAVCAADGTVWIVYTDVDDDIFKIAHCLNPDCSSVSAITLPRVASLPQKQR